MVYGRDEEARIRLKNLEDEREIEQFHLDCRAFEVQSLGLIANALQRMAAVEEYKAGLRNRYSVHPTAIFNKDPFEENLQNKK